MKRFLVRYAIFSTGFLFILYSLNAFYFHKLGNDGNDFAQNKLFEKIKDPTAVFLGDSRTAFAIQTGESKDYFNFAIPGENWKDMYTKAIIAQKEKPGIKAFIVEIDDHTLGAFREGTSHEADMVFFADYKTLGEIYNQDMESGGWFKLKKTELNYFFPLLNRENRQILLSVLGNEFFEKRSEMAERKRVHFDESENLTDEYFADWSLISSNDRTKAARKFSDLLFQGNLLTLKMQTAVGKFFDFCKAKNIAVIGIRYPETKEIQMETQKFPIQTVRSFYASKPFTVILDYEHLFDHHPEYFGDESHLNPKGAKIFTTILLKDLQKHSSSFHAASGDRSDFPFKT